MIIKSYLIYIRSAQDTQVLERIKNISGGDAEQATNAGLITLVTSADNEEDEKRSIEKIAHLDEVVGVVLVSVFSE